MKKLNKFISCITAAIRLLFKTLAELAFENRLKKYFSGKKKYRNA